jgi:hypothetical protein
MSKSRLAYAALVTSMLFSPALLAQDKPGDPARPKQKWEVACEADWQKLCQEEMKKGDVRPCLAKNEDKLSEDCQRTFIRQYKVAELCKDDIEKFCKDAAASGGLGKCFNDNADKLSAKCKSALVSGSKAVKKEEAKAAAADGKTEGKKEDAAAKEAPAKPAKKGKKAKAAE